MKRGRSQDPSFLDLATALLKLRDKDTPAFRKAATDAGISLRKAYYLADVAEQLRPVIRQRRRLEGIGWTRLAVIARHITKEKASELLELAETNTVHQLTTIMRDGTSPSGTRTILLRLHPKDYERFADAIEQHGGKRVGRGLRDQEQALMQIITKVTAPHPPGNLKKPL